MTDTNEAGGQRDRSPAYPNIPLKGALDRLAEFDAHFKRSPARPEKIGDAWGIKGKAYVDRTTAALRYFGLLEYQGSGKDRQINPTDDGRKYLRAQQPETKLEVIKAAALRPKQIAKFWEIWGGDRPADGACLDDLVFKHGFSQKGAADFLRIYDDTITFAGLTESDKVTSASHQKNGDQQEVFSVTPQVHTPPKSPPPAPMKLGQQHAAFPLPEGEVSLSFPANLSVASAQMMASFVKLLIEQTERQAKTREQEGQEGWTTDPSKGWPKKDEDAN